MHRLSIDGRKRTHDVSVNEQDLMINKKQRNPNFDFEETQLLIQLWGDPKMQLTLLTTHKQNEVIAKIAERLKSHGYDRSTAEVRYRLKNIKCLYNRLKRDIETNQPQSYKWKHYDAMDKILNRPTFKYPHAVPRPANLNISQVDSGLYECQVLGEPKDTFTICQIKEEPSDFNDNEILKCPDNEKPINEEMLHSQIEEEKTNIFIDDGILECQIKEEPLDIIDDGIEENIVIEAPQKIKLHEEMKPPETKLVGKRIKITIPTKPTSIQSTETKSTQVLAPVASTSYAKEKVTTPNIIKTIRIPVIPYLSQAAFSSQSNVNSTVTSSKYSQIPTTMPKLSLISDNSVKRINIRSQEAVSTRNRSLMQQHKLSQQNITILQQNHAKQKPIGSTLMQNVLPLIEAEAVAQAKIETESTSTPSTSKNPSQPVPGKSSLSFNKDLNTIMQLEEKRLSIECKRLEIEQKRLKIELDRFDYKKNKDSEVLALLKLIVAMKDSKEVTKPSI